MKTTLQLVSETIDMDDDAAFAHVAKSCAKLTPEQMEATNHALSDLRDRVKRCARALQPSLDEAAKQMRLATRKARLKRELADAEAGIERPAEKIISLGG